LRKLLASVERFACRLASWLASVIWMIVATIPALIISILYVTLKSLRKEPSKVTLNFA